MKTTRAVLGPWQLHNNVIYIGARILPARRILYVSIILLSMYLRELFVWDTYLFIILL